MDRDEILDRYEDKWRDAAMSDRRHFGFGAEDIEGTRGPALCAWIQHDNPLEDAAMHLRVLWVCPECQGVERDLSSAMIHTNNDHRWTWLDFANKWRGRLEEGERLARSYK